MKTNDPKKIQDGDILFSVDPQKLVISKTNVREVKNGYGKITVKNISYAEEQSISIDNFPAHSHGLLFFRTQNDAEEFIKTQIGL